MSDFQIPEDLGALDDSALAEALDQALATAASYNDVADEDLTDEDLDQLKALADFATSARETVSQRGEAAAARSAEIAAARATLTAPEVIDAEIIEEPVAEEAKEPVVAAARKPIVARAAVVKAAKAEEIVPTKALATLTASADVPGFGIGSDLGDLDEVGKAVVARMQALPTHRLGGEKGIQNRYSVAKIDLSQVRTQSLNQSEFRDDQSLLAAAGREARLPGGSLTAAGGWCAPSETLYDLCSIESTDGLLDLPTVNVSRGGLRFTKGPQFSDLYTDPDLGWVLTEAQVIAGTPEKTCIDIACPDFEEVRLDAIGLCVRVPLLTQAAYPELVRRTIELALIAHQHKVDANLIGRIVAGSTALGVTGQFETTIDSIAKLEQAANYIRQADRMAFSETLEMLAPYWYKATVRADLARRTGVDLINVTDATIEGYFTQRGLRIQWLYNYQPLTLATGSVATPDEVDVVIYPAGTWVKGTTDVISLDAVYDSQSLLQNMFTALFVEEGVMVANTCFESYKVTLSTCASGRTGAADITSCIFEAATP